MQSDSNPDNVQPPAEVGWNMIYDDEWVSLDEANARIADLEKQLAEAREERDDYRHRKDNAYEERNRVVAALARLFPSGLARTAIEGWNPEWHGCVYIDTPVGQLSWHFHDAQAFLFEGLPPYQGVWDGHTTEEKYKRLTNLIARADLNEAKARLADEYAHKLKFRQTITAHGERSPNALSLSESLWLEKYERVRTGQQEESKSEL